MSRMPLGVKLAFILVAALLLPGVAPKSFRRSVEATATPYPSVTDGPKADNLETEAALEKNELDSNEMVTDSSEVENSLKHDATESTLLAEDDVANAEEANEEMAHRSDDYSDSKEVDDTAEGEIPPDLVGDDGITEDDIAEAAEMMSLIVKRATEEIDKARDPQSDSIDVDNFEFSDFPKIIEPFVRAFSGSEESEDAKVPSEDDLFYWFPAMKKFLDFMEDHAAKPTGMPQSSATKPARRSGLPTSPEPSRQIAPASTQPAESDVLPPTLQDVFVTPELPTIAGPLSPDQPSLSDVSDTEESVY